VEWWEKIALDNVDGINPSRIRREEDFIIMQYSGCYRKEERVSPRSRWMNC